MESDVSLQSFEEVSAPSSVAPRLAALRAELKRIGLDGFIVPRADEHQGEYMPPNARRLAWLSAFTGSAGVAVVLPEEAAIFVDGRYTLQVRAQTDTALFTPLDLTGDGLERWIEDHAQGLSIGFDPWLHTADGVARLRKAAETGGFRLLACDRNPIDTVWTDRPSVPVAHVFEHPFALAGEEAAAKRARIGDCLAYAGADAAVLTLPDSIAWAFNIRGRDIPYTPFVLAFAILHADGSADLFVDARKVPPQVMSRLGLKVRLCAPSRFLQSLSGLSGKTVIVDPATAAAAVFDRLAVAGARILRRPDPCQVPKACKNPVELEGARKAHIRDGAAMVSFLAWFAAEAPKGTLTEISAAVKLESCRKATGFLADLSFDSISAAGPHAALPHYHVTVSSNRPIAPGDIYLIDSGGQYPDGTTDITRTAIVGTPTAEMKDRFTRVLKSHIALATARFPEGTCGVALDAIARKPLWDVGLDFDHGTGHGVGSYLSVHEGPQRISKHLVDQALLPGMVVSDEPGYYREGAFGIRTENLLAVRTAAGKFERTMLEFEVLTLCPIDTKLIEVSLLSAEERAWLNAYHARVRDVLSEFVAGEALDWLIRATETI
jgi:Xaa-Pro aminopeptidase